MTLEPGAAVRVEMTKWGDRPHWEIPGSHLGADEHGVWIGIPAGTRMSRPGATYVAPSDQVVLVPRSAGWVATFHAPGSPLVSYVDMTTVPSWSGTTCRAVDLDLDVVRLTEGDVFVDDEDEFAEHRVAHDYPDEVVSLAQEACAWVLEQVSEERAPFDGGTAARWFAVHARLVG